MPGSRPRGPGRPTPSSTARTIRSRSPASPTRSACCRRSTPSPAARDPRVAQVMASLAGERRIVEILRADGRLIRDVRPLVQDQRADHRREGRPARERHVRRRRARLVRGLDHPRQVARAGRRGAAPGAGQPGGSALPGRRDGRGAGRRLERRAAARGGRPRPGGRLQPQGHQRLLGPHRRAGGRAGRHRFRRRLDPRPPRLADRRRRGHAHRAHHPDRGRHPRRLHARPPERPADGAEAHRQRAAPVVRPHADAADDQHRHARRPGQAATT